MLRYRAPSFDNLTRLGRIEARKLGRQLLRGMPALRYRLIRPTILLAGFLLTAPALNPLGASILAAAEKRRAPIHVAIEQGSLTVDVRDAPLAEVLLAIAEEASFRLTLRGDLSGPVTWSFSGVPLDDGIKILVGDNSLVMIHARAKEGKLLSKVWVRASERGVVTIELKAPDPMVYRGGVPPEGTARLRSVRQLARRGDEAAADKLVSLLAQDEDPVVRRIAAGGLGKIGGERAVAALKAALVDEDSSIQRRAIFELGRIGENEAAETLAEVLGNDPDADIRRFAARTLARLNSTAARSALEAALEDRENSVRAAAAAALSEWQSSFRDSD